MSEEHDAVTSRRHKEDADGLAAALIKAQAKAERYRVALLRFKSKEITYSFDGRQKAARIVDEALHPTQPAEGKEKA